MNSDDDPRGGQPVEPREARARGNDPDAVRIEDSENDEREPQKGDAPDPDGELGRVRRSSGIGGSRQEASSSGSGGEETNSDDLDLRTDPGQDAGRWRARGPLTETYARGGHGARLYVGDEAGAERDADWDTNRNDEREADRGDREPAAVDTEDQESRREADREAERENRRERDRETDREADRGTSFPSVIFGWLSSLGAAPILFGIIGAIVGGIVALLGLSATAGGIISSVGFLVALFLVFLIGGYVAGRLASRQGLKHGLFVPLLVFILVVLLAVAGGVLGSTFSNVLGSAVPASLAQNIPTSIPQGLGIVAIVSLILIIIIPFLGGALGGLWGGKKGRERP